MSAPFQPGDVVVCVKRRNRPVGRAQLISHKRSQLRIGAYYSIAKLFLHFGTPAVLLNEIAPAVGAGFPADRFRKIDDEVDEAFRQQMRSLGKQRERVE